MIAEDDFTSRLLMKKILENYGMLTQVDDGRQAVEAVRIALKAGQPYHLICLDIMMPKMDGQTALIEIRKMEESMGTSPGQQAKIIMTTALADKENVIKAARHLCTSYLLKPIDKPKMLRELQKLRLIAQQEGIDTHAHPDS